MSIFPQKGKSKAEILSLIRSKKEQDYDWRNGQLFCSIYDGGEELESVVKEAYMEFLTENTVDPTLFPSLRDMENEVVKMSAEILQGNEAAGTLTTGGTESILLAIKTAKNRAKVLHPEITHPEIILPYTVHSAFYKACDYFDVKPVVIPITSDYRADVKAIEKAITPNTILIAASAPSYVFGVIDPIKEIGEIALKNNLLFHVDACIGGIILAFDRIGKQTNLSPFDFSNPGVTSISMDWHKYGYAAKGCSVLLHRDKNYRQHQFFVCTEWSGYTLVNPTILSTKSGGPVAGCWAAIHYQGIEGYVSFSKTQLETTQKLVNGINAIEELEVLGNPDATILSFTSEKINIYDLYDVMNHKGWFLQFQMTSDYCPANLHMNITMAHGPKVENFLAELKEGVKEVTKKGVLKKLGTQATVKAAVALASNLSPENFKKLEKLLGFSNGKVPENFALINQIMDKLPNETVKSTLVAYFNDFYTYQENR